MTKTLNLDALNSEKKVITLGGKEFDVTRMPIAVFLEVQKLSEEKPSIPLVDYRIPLTTWLQHQDPSITSEWVAQSTDDFRMLVAIRDQLFNGVLVDPLPGWISDSPSQDPETKKTQKQIS